MQITADISKIWRTVKRGLVSIFNALLGSAIGFISFLVKMVFPEIEGA